MTKRTKRKEKPVTPKRKQKKKQNSPVQGKLRVKDSDDLLQDRMMLKSIDPVTVSFFVVRCSIQVVSNDTKIIET